MSKVDMVNHPPHYQGNGLEAIEVIEDWQLGYHLGNAVKYILRAGKKGSRKQDLEKALWYVRRAMEQRPSGLKGSICFGQIAEAFNLRSTEAYALHRILFAVGRCERDWKAGLSDAAIFLQSAIDVADFFDRRGEEVAP